HIDPAASRILLQLVRTFATHGKHLLFTHIQGHPKFRRFLEEAKSFDEDAKVLTFPELDPALEWCETQLIVKYGLQHESPRLAGLSEHQLCRNLKKADVAYLESLVKRERFNSGDLIIRRGEAADKLYFLTHGEVSVLIYLPNGQPKRLSTLSAGMGFGELA